MLTHQTHWKASENHYRSNQQKPKTCSKFLKNSPPSRSSEKTQHGLETTIKCWYSYRWLKLMKLLLRTHGRNKAVVCTSFLHRCATIVCVCVCVLFLPAEEEALLRYLFWSSVWGSDKNKGFRDSKRPWTLESMSNTTREPSNGNAKETCSHLYHIGHSAQRRARKTCRALLAAGCSRECHKSGDSFVLGQSEPSTYHHDHQGWMESGQETIFCWVLWFR